MREVRVIALGNPAACDDGAAMEVAGRFEGTPGVEVVLAGRPGAGLLDLLDPDVPTLVLDVVRLGAAPGAIVELAMKDVAAASLDGKPISSHGFGLAQTLKMAEVLGRRLPRGIFLGFGGRRFDPGTERTEEVEVALDALEDAARGAIEALARRE